VQAETPAPDPSTPWAEPTTKPDGDGAPRQDPDGGAVYRPGRAGEAYPALDLSTDGFDPQARGDLKDDLDVPAFLRKQMD
jgi:hypothetical protein